MSWNACQWLLDRHIDDGNGDRPAFRVDGTTISYEGVQALVVSAAAGLQVRGIGPGDRVVLALLDSPELVSTFLACLRIGAIAVLVNPLLPWRDVGAIVDGAEAGLVLASAEPRRGHRGARRRGAGRAGNRHRLRRVGRARPADASVGIAATTEDSPGFWLCTSGSTGRPKLAMHRHYDLKVTVDTYAREVLDIQAGDVFFSVGPLFHAYGLGNSLSFPMSVGALTVLEAPRPPTPERVAEIVRDRAAVALLRIPTFYAALNASDIPDDTFASVRLAVSAAEPLPAETWHRFHERFGVEILDGIGSTEMTHIFLSNRPSGDRPGTTGQPVTGYDVRVVDETAPTEKTACPGIFGCGVTQRRPATTATPMPPRRHSAWATLGTHW